MLQIDSDLVLPEIQQEQQARQYPETHIADEGDKDENFNVIHDGNPFCEIHSATLVNVAQCETPVCLPFQQPFHGRFIMLAGGMQLSSRAGTDLTPWCLLFHPCLCGQSTFEFCFSFNLAQSLGAEQNKTQEGVGRR
jgi:hypothetical protein